jgi:SRSO17 transposase
MRNARSAWPVSIRLYLPKEWATDPDQRQKARIPDTVQFQTKAEIALDLLDQANAWKVRHACVVADADYGVSFVGVYCAGRCHPQWLSADFDEPGLDSPHGGTIMGLDL